MTHHVLSLGAGVNSTALLHVLVDRRMPLDEVVFADTGAEKSETYEYIENRIKPFLADRGIPYATVKAKTLLIERCLQGHTVPDRRFRWSTRDMKVNPIKRYLKPKAPITTYLGIAYDEIHRVRTSGVDWIMNQYPLVDLKITRLGCVKIIADHGWDVPVKSGCFFCPFNGKREWFWLWKNHRDQFEFAKKLEKNGSKYPNFALVNETLEELEKQFPRMLRNEAIEAEFTQTTLDDECSGYCMV